tara:strand:+ start:473 stop:655 length:183 start_codon:yes stop_codon:yes gene_type:complete
MGLKDLLDRIKLTFCCKSKCSLNEVVEKPLSDANEWVDDIQDDIKQIKQYNYYTKKKYTI